MDYSKYPKAWRGAAAILSGDPNAMFEAGFRAALRQLSEAEPEPSPEPVPEMPTPTATPVKLPEYVQVVDITMEWDDATQGWIDK